MCRVSNISEVQFNSVGHPLDRDSIQLKWDSEYPLDSDTVLGTV